MTYKLVVEWIDLGRMLLDRRRATKGKNGKKIRFRTNEFNGETRGTFSAASHQR